MYGSETGTAKTAITRIANSLGKDSNVEIVDTKEGNGVGPLDTLKEKYDVILVSTSSFGEGDPPGNYGNFLAKLLKAPVKRSLSPWVTPWTSCCSATFQHVITASSKPAGC